MNIEQILSKLNNPDEIALLEFELEAKNNGLIVTFTSQRTNICRKQGNLDGIVKVVNGQTFNRSVWRTYKYIGMNYAVAWDTDFSGKPSAEFEEMQQRLQRDGFVPDFDYNLRRSGDNALVRYQSSFFLFPDPLGEPGGIRACISRPQDFEILELGNWELAKN